MLVLLVGWVWSDNVDGLSWIGPNKLNTWSHVV